MATYEKEVAEQKAADAKAVADAQAKGQTITGWSDAQKKAAAQNPPVFTGQDPPNYGGKSARQVNKEQVDAAKAIKDKEALKPGRGPDGGPDK